MRTKRSHHAERQLKELLTKDHTLNGGILFGLDGYIIEVQARDGGFARPEIVDVRDEYLRDGRRGRQ